MTAAKVRLLVVAGLFLLWIGYLSYLALPTTTARDVKTSDGAVREFGILARPQFLISTLDVIAQVDDPAAPTVRIAEVIWPLTALGKFEGKEVPVKNLAGSRGWSEPGLYILPLVQQGPDYYLAPIPRSPGADTASRQPRLYRATPVNREQLRLVPKPAAN